MSNLIEVKIPYSLTAVNDLVALERTHRRITYSNGKSLCLGELNDTSTELTYGPCPVLTAAQDSASLETKVAVTLMLLGEQSNE